MHFCDTANSPPHCLHETSGIFSPQGKFRLPNFHLERISSEHEEILSIEDFTEVLICSIDVLLFIFLSS
jgi:hypothetical protein